MYGPQLPVKNRNQEAPLGQPHGQKVAKPLSLVLAAGGAEKLRWSHWNLSLVPWFECWPQGGLQWEGAEGFNRA